ncbi:hypothetical protein HZS_303 [Henneguya salminicola]|nr:hypothetical protein HZS_303 [Henneguya salminicola]
MSEVWEIINPLLEDGKENLEYSNLLLDLEKYYFSNKIVSTLYPTKIAAFNLIELYKLKERNFESKDDIQLIEEAFVWIKSNFSYIMIVALERIISSSITTSFSNIGYCSLLNLISISFVDIEYFGASTKSMESFFIASKPCVTFLQVRHFIDVYGKILNTLFLASKNFGDKLVKNINFWRTLLQSYLPFYSTALCFPIVWYPKIEAVEQKNKIYFGSFTSVFDYCVLKTIIGINKLTLEFIEWVIIYMKNYFQRIVNYIETLEIKYNKLISKQEENPDKETVKEETTNDKLEESDSIDFISFIEIFYCAEQILIDYDLKADSNKRYYIPEMLQELNNFGIFNKSTIFDFISIVLNERIEFSDNQNIIDLTCLLFKVENYMDQIWLNNYWSNEGRFTIEINKKDIGVDFNDFKEFFYIFFTFISNHKCTLCAIRRLDINNTSIPASKVIKKFSDIFKNILDKFPTESGLEFHQIIRIKTTEENLNFCHNVFNICNELDFLYERKNENDTKNSIFDDFSEDNKDLFFKEYLLPLIEYVNIFKKCKSKKDFQDMSFILRLLIRKYKKLASRIALQPLIEGLLPANIDRIDARPEQNTIKLIPKSANSRNFSSLEPLKGVLMADILLKRIIKKKEKNSDLTVKAEDKTQTSTEEHMAFNKNFPKFMQYLGIFKFAIELVLCGDFPPSEIFKGVFHLSIDATAMMIYFTEIGFFIHQCNNGYIPQMFKLDESPEYSCLMCLKSCMPKILRNFYRLGCSIIEAISDIINYEKSNTIRHLIFSSIIIINEIIIFISQSSSKNYMKFTINNTKLTSKKLIAEKGKKVGVKTLKSSLYGEKIEATQDMSLKKWQAVIVKLIYDSIFNKTNRNSIDYMKICQKSLEQVRITCYQSYQKIMHFYFYYSQKKSLQIDINLSEAKIIVEDIFIFLEKFIMSLIHLPVLALSRILSSSDGYINNLTLCVLWEMIRGMDDSIVKSASIGFLIAAEKWPKETYNFMSKFLQSKNIVDKFFNYRVENLFYSRYFVYTLVDKSILWMKLPSLDFSSSNPSVGVELQSCRADDSSWSDSTLISTGIPKEEKEEETEQKTSEEEINLELLVSGNLQERTKFEENSMSNRAKYLLLSTTPILDTYLYFPYYAKRNIGNLKFP